MGAFNTFTANNFIIYMSKEHIGSVKKSDIGENRIHILKTLRKQIFVYYHRYYYIKNIFVMPRYF